MHVQQEQQLLEKLGLRSRLTLDVVLAVGVEQMGKDFWRSWRRNWNSEEGLLGSGTMPAVFAEAGMEHTRQYGTTFEQFAKVSVKPSPFHAES